MPKITDFPVKPDPSVCTTCGVDISISKHLPICSQAETRLETKGDQPVDERTANTPPLLDLPSSDEGGGRYGPTQY